MNLEPLRSKLTGDAISPADGGWDAARTPWNLVADQRPALVVSAADAADVVTTVQFARANGLHVAPQGTGHGSPSIGDLSDAVLLRTTRIADVAVDPAARRVRVGAGARWGDVVGPLAEHGLAALHGFSPTVGVAGYVLGGGVGWLARREGLASTHVHAFDVVTADGERRRVDADSESDLFWALRGGGGLGAIVTALELDVFELREAYAGVLMWPIELAEQILAGYREWIGALPDSVTSSVRLLRLPPAPELPEPLRGKSLVAVLLAASGGQGEEVAAPLRALAPPVVDMLGTVPAAALAEIAGDPPGPLPGLGDGLLLDAIDGDVLDALLALAGAGVQSPLTSVELRHLGGALRSPSRDAGAIGAIDAEAVVFGVGVPATPEIGAAIHAALGELRERFAAHAPEQRSMLLAFAERERDARPAFAPGAADRLARVVAAYDPDGLLHGNHTID